MPALTQLSEAQRRIAQQRFDVLRPALQDTVPLARAARDAEVAERTARRWLAAYRSGGLAALAPGTAEVGTRRTDAALVEVIEAMALQRPPPTAAYVWRRVSDIATERGLPAPGYTTVRDIIAAIDPGLSTLAHQGAAAYRDRYELALRREADGPNAIWQADHTQLDVMILDDRGRAVRPWLTIVLDDFSRAIAGYAVFIGAPSSHQTALALRHAI